MVFTENILRSFSGKFQVQFVEGFVNKTFNSVVDGTFSFLSFKTHPRKPLPKEEFEEPLEYDDDDEEAEEEYEDYGES